MGIGEHKAQTKTERLIVAFERMSLKLDRLISILEKKEEKKKSKKELTQ